MKRLIRTIAILCFIWLTGGCEKDTEPTWIAPKMEIQVVSQDDIKRKSAILKGNIGENDLEITECGFLYSINKTLLESKALGDKDVIKVLVEQTSGEVKVQLEELIPGTNYFYCLFITCGNTTKTIKVLRSQARSSPAGQKASNCEVSATSKEPKATLNWETTMWPYPKAKPIS